MKNIQRALANIPKYYRIPFAKYFEGHEYHEIEGVVEIPLGTVKTRLHLARQLL